MKKTFWLERRKNLRIAVNVPYIRVPESDLPEKPEYG